MHTDIRAELGKCKSADLISAGRPPPTGEGGGSDPPCSAIPRQACSARWARQRSGTGGDGTAERQRPAASTVSKRARYALRLHAITRKASQ